ncbi:MAG: phosphoribosyltransferase [Guyparkeria sp.]|uniref:phosphoribosyltransferase n=1 Tax=Guyparkeria sp. TaxID=2035736 RepID=UPI00397E62BF
MTVRQEMPVQRITLDEVVAHCDRVARQVAESGFRPDTVVAVARGGFAPARFLCDFLDVSRLLSLQLRHYRSGGRAESRAEVSEPLSGEIAGRRVLLVDDVNDSGDTLAAALPYLKDFRPAELRTAVLHEKANTAHRADFHSGFVEEWRWLLYPWAVVEDAGQFLREMDPCPTSVEAARQRLEAAHGLVLSGSEIERVLFYNGIRPA